MPRSYAGVVAFARDQNNPNAAGEHASWAGRCEEFINNAGDFDQAYGSAILAGDASGPLRMDFENAGVGAIIYWAGVGGDGHDSFVHERGADPLLLMASAAVDENWGRNIGLIRLSSYQRKFGHPLRGWTYRHGTQTLVGAGTAGGGTEPINQENDMSFSFVKQADNATIFACSLDNGRRVGIGSPYHWSLLDRFRKGDGGMLLAELDICRNYLRTFEPDISDAAKAEILARINAVAVTPKALADAVKAAGVKVDATLPESELQRISGVVASELGKSGVSPTAIRDAMKATLSEGVDIDAEIDPKQFDEAFGRFAKLLGIRIAGGTLAGA